ncbi:MAG: hypothetical protein ACTSP9_00780, partial [Promethearchaeota archaeon]
MKIRKVMKKENKTIIFLASFVVLLSLNLYLNTVFARDEFVPGFSTSDSINADETVNYHFSNNIHLSISSNIFINLDIDYESRIENKQIHIFINNSNHISLNITSKENLGNFGVLKAPQDPNKGNIQYQNRYNCVMLVMANVSIENMIIRSSKGSQYGFSLERQYSLGVYEPSGESWEIFDTSEQLNESNSEVYLETSLSLLNASTEYYITYFEVSNIFDNWIWVSFFVILFSVLVAAVIMISKSDYMQYLRMRTVPI